MMEESPMSDKLSLLTVFAIFSTSALAQTPTPQAVPPQRGPVPIYQVTVIERTVKAVNYQYRSVPTRVDFVGTVLLPKAKGGAAIESKAGRVEINAEFDRLEAATRFGPEYLTYVLWAITPEGHAKNLGELLTDSGDDSHLKVTTDLQTFGMIVTAEPYAAVRQPSNVVVLENEIRKDTVGQVHQIQARYELLPRGHYTYVVPKDVTVAGANAEKLPMDRYEALLEVYQAQNAVQIARSQGADRYASDTLAKAEADLKQAQEWYQRKVDRNTIVTRARQAAQTAEDARVIASQRKKDEELALAKSEVAREQQLRQQAEAETQRLRAAQASTNGGQNERERLQVDTVAAQSITTQPATVVETATTAPSTVVVQQQALPPMDSSKTQLRLSLLRELSAAMTARDTPRGLVVEIPDADFVSAGVRSEITARLQRVAALLAANPNLYVAVEGHGDRFSSERAIAVRDALVRAGAPAGYMSARGFGNTRPLGPNATQNRRVEITISGDPIGSTAYWDRSYQVIPR
jgi:flagellar motor protein MotB